MHDDRGPATPGLRALFAAGTAVGVADGSLLDRFAERGDAAAFEALVARHGPMVWRVCRAELPDPHAAEDAFQASFLVLARRAGSIRARDSVASWLFGVATRVAARARVDAARRRKHERRAAELTPTGRDDPRDAAPDGPPPGLAAELDRLPARYRAAIVLCYLEGRSCGEAAQQLGRPVGTVKTHLARGRQLLRRRLGRRGIDAPAGLLAAGGASPGAGPVPGGLARRAIDAVVRSAAGGAVPSARIVAWAFGEVRAMIITKICATLAVATALGSVTWALDRAGLVGSPPPSPLPPVLAPPVAADEPSPRPADRPGGPAEAALDALLAAGTPPGDAYEMVFALRRLARALDGAGDRPGALAILEAADRRAGTVPDQHLRRLALMRTAVARGQLGDRGPAWRTLEGFAREGAALAGQPRSDLMSMVIDFEHDAGFPDEARRALAVELAAAEAAGSPAERDGRTYRLLTTQIGLGDYDGALDQAARYADDRSNFRASLIQTILSFQTAPGRAAPLSAVRRARDLVDEVALPYPRALAEVDVAGALARAGDVAGALIVARGIDGERDPAWEIRATEVPAALIQVARAQAQAGDRPGATAALDEALIVLGTARRRDVIFDERVARVVAARAYLGDVAGATAAADLIAGDPDTRASARVAIAKAQARAGDLPAARASLTEALRVARTIAGRPDTINDNPGTRLGSTLRAVAVAQAEVGDLAAARATADGFGDAAWKRGTLAEVAPIPARRGDFAGALQAAGAVPGATVVYETLGAIQAEAGDAAGALAWAEPLPAPARAFAVVGINEGLARARARARPVTPR